MCGVLRQSSSYSLSFWFCTILIVYIFICSDLYVFGITVFLYLGIWTWILLKVDSFWSSLCNKGNTFPHIFVF